MPRRRLRFATGPPSFKKKLVTKILVPSSVLKTRKGKKKEKSVLKWQQYDANIKSIMAKMRNCLKNLAEKDTLAMFKKPKLVFQKKYGAVFPVEMSLLNSKYMRHMRTVERMNRLIMATIKNNIELFLSCSDVNALFRVDKNSGNTLKNTKSIYKNEKKRQHTPKRRRPNT